MEKWIPNWRDPKQYPDSAKTSMHQWAWEFLRRNPEYVNDFKEYSDGPIYTNYMDFLNDYDMCISGNKPLTKYISVNNQTYPGEYIQDVFQRTPGEKEFRTIYQTIAERYGFMYLSQTQLPDPAKEYNKLGQPLFFNSVNIRIVDGRMLDGKNVDQGLLDRDVCKNQVMVTFNLDLPIKKQLEQANRHLQASRTMYLDKYQIKQAVVPKNIKKMFPFYLMVLDGDANGASKKEMAEILLKDCPDSWPDYQGRKKINNWIKAAKKLRDGGYLAIPVT